VGAGRVLLAVTGAAGLAAALGVVLLTRPALAPAPPAASASLASAAEPAAAPLGLYCQFYVFTEQRPRLALYFEVAERDGRPEFRQRYIAEDNGARTDYDGESAPPPDWRLDPTAEPRTLSSRIAVPDTSQAGQHEEDIVIELYGYVPDRRSTEFFEASLKNVHFQNLPGKCRQTAV
jgi:hypothetical protein